MIRREAITFPSREYHIEATLSLLASVFWPRPIVACNQIDNFANASGDGRNGDSDLAIAGALLSDRKAFTATRRTRTFVASYSRSYPFSAPLQAVGELLRRILFDFRGERRKALVSRKLLTPYAGADHIGVTAAVSAKTSNPRYGRRPCRKKPNSFPFVFRGDSTMSSMSHVFYLLRMESILT